MIVPRETHEKVAVSSVCLFVILDGCGKRSPFYITGIFTTRSSSPVFNASSSHTESSVSAELSTRGVPEAKNYREKLVGVCFVGEIDRSHDEAVPRDCQ